LSSPEEHAEASLNRAFIDPKSTPPLNGNILAPPRILEPAGSPGPADLNRQFEPFDFP
jgi:hypothetical protein